MLQRRRLLALAALTSLWACTSDRVTDPSGPSAPQPDRSRDGGGENRDDGIAGAVFTMTNGAEGNSILRFPRAADGSLGSPTSFSTGGRGAGAGLGNQGAVVLSDDGHWLFAVNPGSNDVSVFRVLREELRLMTRVASGGEQPISLTGSGSLLYVLNAGGAGNIAGFHLGRAGLEPIPGSVRPLSGSGVGPAQIGFHPGGRLLVVTEKGTNQLTVYQVDWRGRASAPASYPSSGTTPFGFSFDHRGTLVVSEAFGGAPGASAVSSYDFERGGAPVVRSGSVPNTETAACWVVITANGRYAYTTNTGSGTVSGYALSARGRLRLLDADGATGVTGPGSTPIDLALSRDSRYLYSLNSGNHTISIFRIGSDGSLESRGIRDGLPPFANGLAGQ